MIERLLPGARVGLILLVGPVALAYLSFGILTARETLGCDLLVYRAAHNFLAGLPVYDLSIVETGEEGWRAALVDAA